jgi:tetratricopeptide (TPR) repeat protein
MIPLTVPSPVLLVALACLTGLAPVSAQLPPGAIDPVAAAAQKEEVERVARQNYMSYRATCADLRSKGQLEAAIQCYGVAARLGIDPSINAPELSAADEAEKKAIEAQLKARKEKEIEEEKRKQTVRARINEAGAALGRREILESKRLIDEALKLDPNNQSALLINRLVQSQLRTEFVRRVVTWSVLGTMTLGALVGGFLWLRKAKRLSSLEMIEGPQPGDVFRLEKETTVIGALEKEADWPIVDLSRRISRRHCEITRSKGRYFLVDVSTNGTSVNGRPVTTGEPVLLRRGDLIALTDDIVLKFR